MGTSPPCSLTFFLASRTHLSRVFASTSIGGLFNEQISWNLLFPVTGDVGLGGDVESRGHEVARGVKHDLLSVFPGDNLGLQAEKSLSITAAKNITTDFINPKKWSPATNRIGNRGFQPEKNFTITTNKTKVNNPSTITPEIGMVYPFNLLTR